MSLTLDEGPLLAMQGWDPADTVPAIRFAAELGIATLIEMPRADERPPTLLRTT